MEGSRPFDSEVDFDEPRRARPEEPPPLPARRRGGRDRPPRRDRSETVARVAWAIPWIAVAVTITIVGGGLFAAAMAALACVGLSEFFRMTDAARPFVTIGFAAALALAAAAYFGDSLQIVIALVASVPVIFGAAVLRGDRGRVTLSIAVTVL